MCRNGETNPQGFNVISLVCQLLQLMYTPSLIALTDTIRHTLDTPRIIIAYGYFLFLSFKKHIGSLLLSVFFHTSWHIILN